MTIKIGSISDSDLKVENYHRHDDGWYALRPKNILTARKLAQAMMSAVDNENIIGVDIECNELQAEIAKIGYSDIANIATPCKTGSAALARACCWVSGIRVPAFSMSEELDFLLGTFQFSKIAEPWAEKDLRMGDILVTKTKRHTAIVVSVEE